MSLIYKCKQRQVLSVKNYTEFLVVYRGTYLRICFYLLKAVLVIDNMLLCQSLDFLRDALQNEIINHVFNSIQK